VFSDAEEVTNPGIKQMVYLLLQGDIGLISEERVYKATTREIKKIRRKRERERLKRLEEGEDPKEPEKPP